MEDITDVDYAHSKTVCKDFELKTLGEYQSDTILLANIFENFRNMCINIYEFDPANFFQLHD